MNLGKSLFQNQCEPLGGGSPWSRNLKRECIGFAALGGGFVAAQTSDYILHLLNGADGEPVWSTDLKDDCRRLVGFGDLLLAKFAASHWRGYDLRTGEPIGSIPPFHGTPAGELAGKVYLRRQDRKANLVIDLATLELTEIGADRAIFGVGEGTFLKLGATSESFLGPSPSDSAGDVLLTTRDECGFQLAGARDGLVFHKGNLLTCFDWEGHQVSQFELPEPYQGGVISVSFSQLGGVAIFLPKPPPDTATDERGLIGVDLLTGELRWEIPHKTIRPEDLASSEEWCWVFRNYGSKQAELVRLARASGTEVEAINTNVIRVTPTPQGLIGASLRKIVCFGAPQPAQKE